MAALDLPKIPPTWLKQVPDDDSLDGATSSSFLTPGTTIAHEVGGEIWSVYSLKAYCMARFGKPQADGAWLLATEVPDFYVLAKPRADSGLMFGQFAFRLPTKMQDTLIQEWQLRTKARMAAWDAYRVEAGLVPPQPGSSDKEELARYMEASKPLYQAFIKDGSEARALATVQTSLTDAVDATIRNLAREMMRPVKRPGHGRIITMANTMAHHATPAP